MKKLLLFGTIALLTSTCSTKLDILDNYKETTVVYCLLDQTQPKQYIRIEKAFLGPDNALNMAQQYDSISYLQSLDVKVEGISNGQVVQTFSTTVGGGNGLIVPDTLNTKDPGIFSSPKMVLYSFQTPPGALSSNNTYRLTVTVHHQDNTVNTVTGTTNLIETSANGSFNLVTPSSALNLEPTATITTFDYKWNAAHSARTYTPTIRFYYTEYYVNGDSAQFATGEWDVGDVTTTDENADDQLDVKVNKSDFYSFVASEIHPDNNVVSRRAKYCEFIVYAGNQTLKDYIEINAPSTSLSQDHPAYSNIVNGFGVFAARSQCRVPATGATYIYGLNQFSVDGHPATNFKGLDTNPATCQLNFRNYRGTAFPIELNVPGCQ